MSKKKTIRKSEAIDKETLDMKKKLLYNTWILQQNMAPGVFVVRGTL